MIAAAIILTIICIFNIIMWSVFIHRFNKYFSTDEILEKTRDNLNLMLIDLNNNAERNINLIQGKIDQLKEVSAEADMQVKFLEEKLSEEKMKMFYKSIDSASSSHTSSRKTSQTTDTAQRKLDFDEEPVSDQRKTSKSATKTSTGTEKSEKSSKTEKSPKKEKSVEKSSEKAAGKTVEKTAKITRKKAAEPELNVEEPAASAKTGSKVTKASSAVVKAYGTGKTSGNVPEYYVSKDPIVPKKSFNQQVRELFDMGFTVEQIASKLGCATQEVKFSLEFS